LPFAQRRELVVVFLTEGGLAMADHVDHAHAQRVPREEFPCQSLSDTLPENANPFVTPAETGVQKGMQMLDSRLRGNDS
jgi:hypothetical protein